MDLRQLSYFVYAAEDGSLTAASSRAHVTQSALSRQIKLLEEEFDVDLFERLARGVKLTEAGTVLLARARALLAESEKVKGAVGAVGREPAGLLRIGFPPPLRILMTPVVAQLHAEYPKVKFRLREGRSRAIRDALAAGEIDIGLVSSHDPLALFRVQPLVSEALCWVGPPEAKLSPDCTIEIARLAEKPLILTGHPNTLRAIVEAAMTEVGVSAEPVMEADMASLMIDLVRAGTGYTVLPYGAIHEALLSGQITASQIKGLRIDWVIALSKEHVQTTASFWAIESLKETCSAQVAGGIWRTARRT